MNIELKEITVRDNNPTTQPPNHIPQPQPQPQPQP